MLFATFSKVSKEYAGNMVFDQLDLEIQSGQRIGLVGENGCGKSTLLKLLAGVEEPTEGTISYKRKLTIGYLSQEMDPQSLQKTVFEVVEQVSDAFKAILTQLRRLEQQMADPSIYQDADAMEAVLDAYGRAQELFEAQGGYLVEHKARSVLTGLGITPDQYTQKVGTLSGGEKKMVNLARILVQTPDLLLLDEPDNHLDIEAKAWLEHYIQDYPGTVFLISHDRYLLDQTVQHIFQLEDGTIDSYHGNYSYYVEERQKRLQQRYEDYQNQQGEMKRLEVMLHQYREWVRFNDKFAGRLHSTEKRIARIKEEMALRPIMQRKKMKVRLDPEQSSKKVLEIKGLSQSIQTRQLFRPFDLTILAGERIGIVGANGSGKSTLLKILLGLVSPTQGTTRLGVSILPGYYAQEQETLPMQSTPLEFVCRLKEMSESKAVALLSRLLFSYRTMHTTINNLSGGEKSRLQIARLMVTEANFLLLDEPTNNLDIPSVEVLEDALLQFEGTLLMVSHDRYFLEKIATRILAIDSAGNVRLYPGSYSYYQEKTSQEKTFQEKISIK
ncbi:ribosomal protection-like ABC-F family protein [Tengunoibacter tsumagoiensis]|uniref:ABC transporter ATP-binding protein n=1 Tax=Tengunoibacter tsumagoiensis TaxID=2014871 RepID=A0A401ZXT7_9CHLR|nr:ABC-F family ATP-binding cassette domain-containing protein [Tengunoibacter tsumagoiensis]GCE11650.1 ABC transporter ATP-binding protein [Tengunoibacter tsumagoiensis]